MFRFWNQIIGPLLRIVRPKEILQIGGGAGRCVRALAEYARREQGKLTLVEPLPLFDVAAFKRRWADVFTFSRAWNVDALASCPPPDFVLIDGDHNWYTVYHELKEIESLSRKSGRFPVILLHDVSWPYARRDAYLLPGIIPAEFRQPYAEGGVLPGSERLIQDGGINERIFHAARSGGPRNGVLTALEDFLKETDHNLTVTMVSGFYGLAIITPSDALDTHAGLKEFLASFAMPTTVRDHIDALEAERIENVITAKDLRFSLHTMRVQRDSYRTAMDEIGLKLHRQETEVLPHEKTLSWRITAPLRRASMFVKSIGKKKTWFATLKRLWSAIGQPLPGLTRHIRHVFLPWLLDKVPKPIAESEMANSMQNAYGGSAPVSVIVAARNNGEFLRECLESILGQSVKPMEIIYADDGSEDDSVKIASSYPGVTVLSYPHRGVIATRNDAVAQSTGELLLHVDGDDSIPPDYLRKLLAALASDNAAAFAFGGANLFGIQKGTFSRPWNKQNLWIRNYINTSSLVRRSAFEAVGGWRDIAGTLWDWDLWLRMSRIGHGVASDAKLNYRRHERSWSQLQRQFNFDQVGLLFGRVRRAVASVSVCSIVSGRLPELTDTWIDALVATINASESAVHPPELVVLDNSEGGSMGERIRKALERHPGVFRSVMIVPYPVRFSWKSEMERRHNVSMFLAKAYNRLFHMADGDIVWFLEDDIVVPEHTYETLLRDLTDGDIPPAAVTGLYRARHMDQLVAHRVENGISIAIKDQHVHPLDIDLAGTGCMMVLRPFVTHPFTSHWRGIAPAHDWAWCDEIRKEGHRIVLDPRVRCRHYQTLTEYV